MANQYLHPDVFDDGLKVISDNAAMKIVVTAGVPASLAEATAAVGDGAGKRVSSVIDLPAADAVLGDGDVSGRKVAIPSKSGTVAVSTVGSEDLLMVIYDGTRILAINDETSNQQLTEGNPIALPAFGIALTVVQP